MLPAYWTTARNAILIKRWEQEQRRLAAVQREEVFEEVLITEADIAAVDEQPVTIEDLTALSSGLRGSYREGDTRHFVITQEQRCEQYNCWMVRDKDDSLRLVSEDPSVIQIAENV